MVQAYFLLPDQYTCTWICNRKSRMRTIELELNAAIVQDKSLSFLTAAWISMCGLNVSPSNIGSSSPP